MFMTPSAIYSVLMLCYVTVDTRDTMEQDHEVIQRASPSWLLSDNNRVLTDRT
jgi:hypothetical protein